MTIMVRPVNLETEREQLLDILQRHLEALPHALRFNWLYRDNPTGTAWSWFVYEKQTAHIVGVASVFPRAMWVGRRVELCGQVGDFAIDISYRSLGPALMLQRATFEPVKQSMLAFCYDCPPHDRGMSTFVRLGMEANCQMHRYAKLLRIDRLLAKWLGRGRVWRSIPIVGNFALDWRSIHKDRVPGLEISVHEDIFGEQFSALDRQVGGCDAIRSRRTAEDLNWRYRQDPLHQYRVLTACRRGELIAFVIFTISSEDAYIIDLFGQLSPDITLQLLDAVVECLRKEPVQVLHVFVADGSDLSQVLQKAHFSYRAKAMRVVAYAQPGTQLCTLLGKRPHWLFNYADVLA